MAGKKIITTILFLLSGYCFSIAQNFNPEILTTPWKAYWIGVPGEPSRDYGVFLFRKVLNLSSKNSSFIIHVSADNRYKLFVNSKLVSFGPARSDFFHWNFETVDIAPYLVEGKNVIAAIVWNCGEQSEVAQISWQTGFIIQGDGNTEQIINSNKSWRCIRDRSHTPLGPQLIYSYYAAGPDESVDMHMVDHNWMQSEFNDEAWKEAREIEHGAPKGTLDWSNAWMLVARNIPPTEHYVQRLQEVRRSENIKTPGGFPLSKIPIVIPGNSKVTMLLDQTFLTNAFPTIIFSKGNNAMISIGYAEALYVDEKNNQDWRAQNQKGNRNDIEGKRFSGREDRIESDGSDKQEFTSLEWRTYRFIQLKIETKEEPLTLEDVYGTFVGYPFQLKAKFEAPDTILTKIWNVGWHTARSCAIETFMDCPYYEQLQYWGDTRIQCLVTLFSSGDDRLFRNAIDQGDYSRLSEGITLSRYPTSIQQIIPPFGLWWIGMLHDYWKYRPDVDFVKSKLPAVRQVLWFFSKYQQKDGTLANVPYWNFTDWVESKGWSSGIAPHGKNGNSSILDLQLLWAYQLAAQLEKEIGMQAIANHYDSVINTLRHSIRSRYWDSTRKMFADRSEKDLFSQHANALAILTGLSSGNEALQLARKILMDSTIAQATIYFKFYVHQALAKAGLGNNYLDWLQIWKNNLEMGLTTWSEISDINRTRSDCHAWGAHPNIEFLRIVLGIDSDAPGFSTIRIEPHLGNLKSASGKVPHPKGIILVNYKLENGKWNIKIEVPDQTKAYLIWKGKHYNLKSKSINQFYLS